MGMAKKTEHATTTTRIVSCSCAHEWQDKTYGKGKRVYNLIKSSGPGMPQRGRCTVCGNEKNVG